MTKPPPESDLLQARVRRMLENKAGAPADSIRQELARHHPADVAEAVSDLDEDQRHAVLDILETEDRANVIALMADIAEHAVEEFIEEAPVEELAQIVDEIDPDDAVDLLEVATSDKAEAVIDRLESEHAADVRQLRRYDPDTAGGIMTTEFLWVPPEETRAAIARRLEVEEDEIETAEEVFVCDAEIRLLGLIHASDLITAKPGQTAGELMDQAVIHVVPSTDQEICARVMKKYDIAILPVVDERRRLIGIITHDDILDVLEDEAREDMYRMAGVGDNRPLEHGPWERAIKRLPWLVTTLVGSGLVGPMLMHRWFMSTLDRVVVLAFFIPVIAGIGGNTAIQSSTIAVRGLATGEIDFKDLLWMLRREMTVALIIAVTCALVITAFSYGIVTVGLEESGVAHLPRISFTVGASMFAAIMFSVVLGTVIPMLCYRMGVDPALAAGPFITTLIDISSQIIYFGLATWLLLQ